MEPVEYQSMHDQEQHLWWYRALHDILLERIRHLSLPADALLLDAGCGTGGFLRKLSNELPSLDTIGLEYQPEAINHLRDQLGTSIVNGTLNSLPFQENLFDVITLTDVLYHQNIEPIACLTECRRVLKPTGHLLINISAYNWMQSAHDRQVHTRERYTASLCRQQLEQAGFRIQHVGYWNSLLFPLMALHRLTTGKLRQGSDVVATSQWQDTLLYRIIRTEQFLQRHHIHLPFGGSVWAWASKT